MIIDKLVSEDIKNGLDDFYHQVFVVEETISTNDDLKKLASKLQDGTVLIADHQSSGKGRNGRSFYSPSGDGIYMSIFLKPNTDYFAILKLTAMCAVAVQRSIEIQYEITPKIKWVNDIIINDHKIAGILCESGMNQDNKLDYLIIGIGINVHSYDMPNDLKDIAGCIEDFTNRKVLRNDLIRNILNNLYSLYTNINGSSYLDTYRDNSYVLGKEIEVFENNRSYYAKVIDIDDDARLVIKKEDNGIVTLSSGEITIRKRK